MYAGWSPLKEEMINKARVFVIFIIKSIDDIFVNYDKM